MIKFGTGGWRALIGEDFTKENVCRITQGLANYIKETNLNDKPIIIGGDRRFLSNEAIFWMAEVFAGNKIECLIIKRSVPTPIIMHYVKNNDLNFGIEITASHNPAKYNGIKIIVKEGRDAPIETTNILEKYIEDVKKIDTLILPNKYITVIQNPFNDYLDDLLNVLDKEAIKKHSPRILFDAMYGASVYPLMCIFYSTRCTVDLMNGNRDANFGGMMPAPTENTLGDLKESVVRGGYDLGVALDGDGDRLGIIDGYGEYISANHILVMLYYYLHEYKGWKGGVVRNLSTTHLLDKVAEGFGEKCYEVPIGFKWISSKMDEENAILGGESSGGLTVRGHIHGKDSVYAAALFVEMCSKIKMSPVEFYKKIEEKYGEYQFVESNISFSQEEKNFVMKKIFIEKNIPQFNEKVKKVSYLDGCKVYFENGDFVICRFSGTESLLRIFAESSTKQNAQQYVDCFKRYLTLSSTSC